MKCPLLAIVGRHTEWGPDAAGATSDDLLRETPAGAGGGPPFGFRGSKGGGVGGRVCPSPLPQGGAALTLGAWARRGGGAGGPRRGVGGTPRPRERPPPSNRQARATRRRSARPREERRGL